VTGGRDSFTRLLLPTTEILKGDGTSQPGPDMPGANYDHCQVQMGTSVYVIGGWEEYRSSSVFVLEDLVWRKVSPMLSTRSDHACIAYGGKIYAIGGQDENGALLSTVEMYDPLSDSWQQGPALPVGLRQAQVINHQDIIYLVGGRTDGSQRNAQVFTMSGGEWQLLTGVTGPIGDRKVFPALVLGMDVLMCQ
jgi:N-acetylneuraminic acid mutarotase